MTAMSWPSVFASTRSRLIAAGAIGIVFILAWRALTPPAVSAPKSIAGHPRHEQGYYFDLAERVRTGAAEDPRLGLTVAAAYGASSQPLPTFGVLQGVIKFGNGSEIVGGVLNGLASGGVALGPRTGAPAGRHGGTFECGTASLGADTGNFCVWWTNSVVGVALVAETDAARAQELALAARDATQR